MLYHLMNRCPSDGRNNTLAINPMPVILVVIFCICCLLSLTANAHAFYHSADEEWTKESSNSSVLPQLWIDSVLKCCTLQSTGQEWYLDMVNPSSDGKFDSQNRLTRNSDGSWKMRTDHVRCVYISNGYNSNQITLIAVRVKLGERLYGLVEGLERRRSDTVVNFDQFQRTTMVL